MRRRDLPATKSNLLRLRADLGLVRAGHELLDQKRQVLLEQLIDLSRDAEQQRRQTEEGLKAAYGALRAALVAGGEDAVRAEAIADPGSPTLQVREHSVMGVIIPLLELAAIAPLHAVTAPGHAPAAVSLVRRRIGTALAQLIRLAETEISCRRLALELQKTQRKVSALENIFIPEYRDTIGFIAGALEEKEREGLFHLKRLKARRAAEEGGST
ncbi:MAG: V-type ATP synthase subunit D [Deltaproteobacteria bacterium]|nr:V-type ATP synthase subunit D [Deltaproteobacteria bacterium]